MTLIMQAAACFPEPSGVGIAAGTLCLLMMALALAVGLALIAGLLTPFACLVAVGAGVSITSLSPSVAHWNLFSGNLLTFDVVVMVVVCGLLGPGAFSLDAHLFGRRKVIIPRSPH